MKTRSLLVLILVLAVLVGIILWQKNRSQHAPETVITAGEKVFPELDVNAVREVTITAGEHSTTLEKKGGEWVVRSMHDYPADFPRLADMVRLFAELEAGQVIRDGAAYLDEFGLSPEGNSEDLPITVTLADGEGAELATILLGEERRPSPDEDFSGIAYGRYIRVEDGPVMLVEETFHRARAKGDDWIDKEIVNVTMDETETATVKTAESEYTVRKTGSNSYELEGLKKGEEINPSNAGKLFRALQNLRCQAIADPSLSDKELGFDDPSTFTLATKENLIYTILVGDEKSGTRGGSYARIDVAYKKPDPPTKEEVAQSLPEDSGDTRTEEDEETSDGEDEAITPEESREEQIEKEYHTRLAAYRAETAANEEKVKEVKKRLDSWTYLISKYTADSITQSREDLIKKKK